MKAKSILLLCLLFIATYGNAQTGKLFTADKELSNSLINKVYQDHRGIIWIATEDGLNSYDGSKFTIYKHKYLDDNALMSSYVHTLFEDSRGYFYIGLFNGLQIYNYATDTFKKIPLILDSGEPFDAHVSTILERKNGDLLIGTSGQGVFKMEFNGKQLEAKSYKLPGFNLINCLYEDRKGNLWVSTEEKILSRLGKDNQWKHYFMNDKSTYSISSFCEDKEGNLYIGSTSKGLFIYQESNDTFLPIIYQNKPNLPVKSLYLNNQGEIYIGTDGYGIKTYSPHDKKLDDGNFNITTFDFSKAKVHSIMEDKSGNLWMGIFQKGAMILPNNSSKFNYIGYKSIKNNMIGSNCVMSIYKDHTGDLWVGTDNDGIYIISPNGKLKTHFNPTGGKNSVPSTVLCIYEDSNHDIWVGSFREGMGKVNPRTGHCEYIHLVDEHSNPIQRVYGITEDCHQNLWIATMGAGLYCMDRKTSQITHYPQAEGTKYRPENNELHNAWVSCIMATHNGKIYFGTYDGIGCYDLASKSFSSTFQTNRLFQGYIIYSLYEDADGNIWAGTGNGLAFINYKTHEMSTYNTTAGLPSDVICGIKGDKNNNLWISTNHGISRLDTKTRKYVNYYYSDGLQGNEFSKGAVLSDNDGQMMFAGLNGITYFRPEDIASEEKKMDIRITGFYIHDQAVKQGMKSGSYEIIDASVMDAKNFHLSYRDNSFSIEFSTMEFNNPERIVYMYSMNNENWISLSPGTNRVAFNNLTPGTYHFRVKANDYNAYSEIKEITIKISPAWYASSWAKTIYGLIALALIYLIAQQIRSRYQARQQMQEHLHAEQINEAKLQFFINISHEIRTPMSLIISPLEKLMSVDNDRERQKTYSIIRRNAERILRLINQLMDIRKIDKGQMILKFQETDLVSLLGEIYTIFEYQAKNKKIHFEFHHNMESLNAWIDPKNFDKIIMNILSNAFKFTPEDGQINLYLNTGSDENAPVELQNYIEIIISDSGIGISPKEMERIFERFYQISNSQNNSNIGTGIGLHLTRSLVELHHGIIKVENNKEGKGCQFIIRIPFGKGHLTAEEIEETTTPTVVAQPITSYIELAEDAEEDTKIKSKSKRWILVVEDDEEIRKYLCRELASEYHTMESSNGKEALALILQKAPDLIISDVMMPEMDGITLCRKIKLNVNINHIPIILLTAKSREEDNLEGLNIGADAYLTKPFSIEIVKKTIANIIKNREILRNSFNGNQHQKENIQEISLKSSDEKLLERVMALINANLSNPDFNVEMIATEAGISRVHLHRKLKELTNQTTRDLIRNIRLKQAASLLSSGRPIDIAEVAYATGFTNMPYFSSAFKELYGMSPKLYMEEHLKSES